MQRYQKWGATISEFSDKVVASYTPRSLTALMQAIEADVRAINSPYTLTIKIWKVDTTK